VPGRIVGVFGGAIQCSEGGIVSERSGERVLKGDGGRYRPMPMVRRVLRLNSGVLVAGKSLNVYKVGYLAGCMTASPSGIKKTETGGEWSNKLHISDLIPTAAAVCIVLM